MIDSKAVSLVDSIERYIEGKEFPAIDRIEVFFSSRSEADPLIGGQIVEVKDRTGAKKQIEFAGMFKRLVQYKVTAEKWGEGWNIVCSPWVSNAKIGGKDQS
jgi:lipocalin